jgi:hypothetical protein
MTRDGQQLDRVAQLGRVTEVARSQARDAFAMDVFGPHGRVKGEAGQDRELVHGVMALDIVRGVGFGVTKLLGPGQRVGEVCAITAHSRQDVVGGAVDDRPQTRDVVGRKVALER